MRLIVVQERSNKGQNSVGGQFQHEDGNEQGAILRYNRVKKKKKGFCLFADVKMP